MEGFSIVDVIIAVATVGTVLMLLIERGDRVRLTISYTNPWDNRFLVDPTTGLQLVELQVYPRKISTTIIRVESDDAKLVRGGKKAGRTGPVDYPLTNHDPVPSFSCDVRMLPAEFSTSPKVLVLFVKPLLDDAEYIHIRLCTSESWALKRHTIKVKVNRAMD